MVANAIFVSLSLALGALLIGVPLAKDRRASARYPLRALPPRAWTVRIILWICITPVLLVLHIPDEINWRWTLLRNRPESYLAYLSDTWATSLAPHLDEAFRHYYAEAPVVDVLRGVSHHTASMRDARSKPEFLARHSAALAVSIDALKERLGSRSLSASELATLATLSPQEAGDSVEALTTLCSKERIACDSLDAIAATPALPFDVRRPALSKATPVTLMRIVQTKTESSPVRVAAARDLDVSEESTARSALGLLASIDDNDVRAALVARFGASRTAPALSTAAQAAILRIVQANDDQSAVRVAAARSLDLSNEGNASTIIRALSAISDGDVRRAVVAQLAAGRTAAARIELLHRAHAGVDSATRGAAIVGLGDLNDSSSAVIEAFALALTDPSVRSDAIHAVERLGSKAAPLLGQLRLSLRARNISNYELMGLAQTIEAMGINGRAALPELDALLDRGDIGVARASVEKAVRAIAGEIASVMVVAVDDFTGSGIAGPESSHGALVRSAIQQYFVGEVKDLDISVSDMSGKVSSQAAEIALAAVDKLVQSNPRSRIIVNMSWGNYDDTPILRRITERLVASHIILVASAGNDGEDKCMYPAAYPGVLSVGSVIPTTSEPPRDVSRSVGSNGPIMDRSQFDWASFSNRGNCVSAAAVDEIEAPAVQQDAFAKYRPDFSRDDSLVLPRNNFADAWKLKRSYPAFRHSGTSISAGKVSGWFAQMLRSGVNPEDVLRLLRERVIP